MKREARYSGALAHVSARWPSYLLFFGGGAMLLLVIILASARQGWWAFVLLAFAALLILLYFFGASLWAAYKIEDDPTSRLDQAVIELAQLQPGDNLAHIDLGDRRLATALGRYLTTGRIIVVDVYHPQLVAGTALARARQQARWPRGDPRFIWRDGRLDLLPLPDASVRLVTMDRVLSALDQDGDRRLLLAEIYRVLTPGGRLVLVERPRSQTNWLVLGPAATRLLPLAYWRELLAEPGFRVRKERAIHDLVRCIRADRPPRDEAEQLRLGLLL
jgi:SAM-dependent methyltransferase